VAHCQQGFAKVLDHMHCKPMLLLWCAVHLSHTARLTCQAGNMHTQIFQPMSSSSASVTSSDNTTGV
jgi:hypothetical protein